MLFTTKFLTEIFHDNRGKADNRIKINQVATDSRKPLDHALFIPLVGDNFDGHDYLNQALDQGAVAALWDKAVPLPKFLPNDFPVFYVEDTLDALQHLAKRYRLEVNPIVIGITGSNGKTTTKDILATLLASKYKTHYTLGNLNNHIGVPLTILSMPTTTEMLVLEMGMNHFGEIAVLAELAQPDYAIITNIGESHIEHLGSRAGIAIAKGEILDGLKETGVFIYDGDEPLLTKYRERKHAKSVGFQSGNDYQINQFELTSMTTSFSFEGGTTIYRLPLLGKHHAKNAGYAIAIAESLSISQTDISKALLRVKTTAMRFEVLTGKDGSTIINDAYNASPTSMRAAIEVIAQMTGYQTKILVLGDMFELGSNTEIFHQEIGAEITGEINLVCTIGENARAISDATAVKSEHFQDKQALVSYLTKYTTKETIILVKASRGMKLETVIEPLL